MSGYWIYSPSNTTYTNAVVPSVPYPVQPISTSFATSLQTPSAQVLSQPFIAGQYGKFKYERDHWRGNCNTSQSPFTHPVFHPGIEFIDGNDVFTEVHHRQIPKVPKKTFQYPNAPFRKSNDRKLPIEPITGRKYRRRAWYESHKRQFHGTTTVHPKTRRQAPSPYVRPSDTSSRPRPARPTFNDLRSRIADRIADRLSTRISPTNQRNRPSPRRTHPTGPDEEEFEFSPRCEFDEN